MIRRVTGKTLDVTRETDLGTEEQRQTAADIVQAVKAGGDNALRRFTEKLDGVSLETLRVTKEEIGAAEAQVAPELLAALRRAADRIRRYHARQKRVSWWETEADGTVLGQRIQPLSAVGIYVPGGRAVYPTSVLMNALPAQVAGVPRIAMVSPPLPDGRIHPAILAAAHIAGVTEIYKAGGAQAIAALAYGTESVPRVDKIVGPGNVYVALAKRLVYGTVDIDMVAGPSEVVVLADETANAAYVAHDMLAQAEHDPLASAILVTPSALLADGVESALKAQCPKLARADIAQASLRERGAICLVEDLHEGTDIVNRLAPEHVQLLVRNPWAVLGKISHAGAIFLGEDSPVVVGDYWAGPNHVLPTDGTARFSSPLGVDDFVKRSSIVAFSREALVRDAAAIVTLAESEGLGAHAEAIRVRLGQKEEDA